LNGMGVAAEDAADSIVPRSRRAGSRDHGSPLTPMMCVQVTAPAVPVFVALRWPGKVPSQKMSQASQNTRSLATA
jgi:hypothetical protein